ncbi:MAG TPA: sialidase family protein [Ktedonobacteraceae bacterium]|nr:sialidase family protein [Ktedonobacteraceae bacterium]
MSAIPRTMRRSGAALALAIAVLLTLSTASLAFAASNSLTLLRISKDPYTNTSSQHKTQVEPDTFSYGNTEVSVFQSGRFSDGGSSNIGFATSTNNGSTWTSGFLPDTTIYATPAGKFQRVSDASVAYDAKHNTWVVSYLGLTNGGNAPVDVASSHSTDGGLTWSNPVSINSSGDFNDKNWSVCDDTSTSKYYGNCYTEYDDNSLGDAERMSTSTDGGQTWSTGIAPAGNPTGLGGQPVVQPNGTVIVPFEDLNGTISDFMSTNGGSSWTSPVTIASIDVHYESGNIRTSPLPSAEIDGSGTVYVAWQDCRFESGCSANDIVFSTSSDGKTWSTVKRVPSNPVGSGVDHFIPGIAVDKSTSGSSAHVAVTYYYFSNTTCSSNCKLYVGYISSVNGGSTWSKSKQLAGPMNLSWLASTNQGNMVGDYISTSITSTGRAFPVIAVAKAPKGTMFHESMFTMSGGLAVKGGTIPSSAVVVDYGHVPAFGRSTTAF